MPTFTRVMKIGTVGQDVQDVQNMLEEVFQWWGDKTPVPTTGQYGVKTSWAVRNFQKRQNSPQTGIMDSATFAKLAWCHECMTQQYYGDLAKS